MSPANLPPVLFIQMRPNLTKAQQAELLSLDNLDIPEGANEDRLRELEAIATRRPLLAELLPIPIDGEVIPAQYMGATTQMNKSISIVGDEYLTEANINTTTITIATNTEGLYQTLADILMHLADYVFGQHERAPNCAFFADGAVIPRGFIVGASKAWEVDTNREMISLTIARDLADLIPQVDSVKGASVFGVGDNFKGGITQ